MCKGTCIEWRYKHELKSKNENAQRIKQINSKTESKPKQETIKAIKVLLEVMTIME